MMIDAIKRVPSDFVGLGRTLGLSDRKTLLRLSFLPRYPRYGMHYA